MATPLSPLRSYPGAVIRDASNEIVQMIPAKLTEKVALCLFPEVRADRTGAYSLEPNVAPGTYQEENDPAAPPIDEIGAAYFLSDLSKESDSLTMRRVQGVQKATIQLFGFKKTKLPLLVLGGHGDENGLKWGAPVFGIENELNCDALEKESGACFVEVLNEVLTVDATVVIPSCGVGAPCKGINFATVLAMKLPGRTIYAASDFLYGVRVISGTFPPKVTLVGGYEFDVTVRLKCDPETQVCTSKSNLSYNLRCKVKPRVRKHTIVTIPKFKN